MKRETGEYNYDWMVWSILDHATKGTDGSRKEYEGLLQLVPHFAGEPGTRFLKLIAEYTGMFVTAKEQGKKVALTSYCTASPILYAFPMRGGGKMRHIAWTLPVILFADAFDDRIALWEAVTEKMSEFIQLRRIIA